MGEYQNSLPQLSQIPKGQGQLLITNQPGVNGLADVMNETLIPYIIEILRYLFLFEKRYEFSQFTQVSNICLLYTCR